LSDRLPAGIEATAIMRRAESEGGFATIIRKGDADRGAITLLITQRGTITGVLERQMTVDFTYRWTNLSADRPFDGADWRDFLAKKVNFDPDFWAIELDVPDAQRFIAETTGLP
jgi:hypothetical protein